ASRYFLAAGARPIEGNVIELSTAVIVEGKGAIGRRPQVVTADSGAGVALVVDWGEGARRVLPYADCTGARPIESDLIELSAAVIVEGKGAVGRRPQVITADSGAGVALVVDWGEG